MRLVLDRGQRMLLAYADAGQPAPVCCCSEPETDALGMCSDCKRKPLALLVTKP